MISEADLEPCTIAVSVKPGDKGVVLGGTKTRIEVLEVFEVKMSAYKPEEGKVAYRINDGSGPRLVMAHQIQAMSQFEKDYRVLYVELRNKAVDNGMSKEDFDVRMKRTFRDPETFLRYYRVQLMSPSELMQAVHFHFAILNLVDSPIQRNAMLAEIAQLYFLKLDLVVEEFSSWIEKNKHTNPDQLASDAVKSVSERMESRR